MEAFENLCVPGTRPNTRGRSNKGTVDHDESWDSRFWLSTIPDYHAARNRLSTRTYTRGRKSVRLPQINSQRITPRHQLYLLTHTRSVKSLPRRRELSEETITSVQSELNEAWNSFNVPEFHREAFLKMTKDMPSAEVIQAIAHEVKSLKSSTAPILKALNAVSTRELLLRRLREYRLKEDDLPKRSVMQTEAADMLQKYRTVSIEAVEHIIDWKKRFNDNELKFMWEGQSYLAKMKLDLAFLKHSELSKVFSFPMDKDIFLMFVTAPPQLSPLKAKRMASGRLKVNIPMSSEMISRLRRVQIQLKLENGDDNEASLFEPNIELGSRFSQEINLITEPEISQITDRKFGLKSSRRTSFLNAPESPARDLSKVSVDKIPSSIIISNPIKLKAKLEKDKIVALASELAISMIEEVLNVKVAKYARESSVEVMIAALILHSSNILDRIINDVLKELIPEVAREAWNEETDIEYIDFQVQIVDAVVTSEVESCAITWVNEILCEEVKSDYIKDVFFEDIVQEAIDEEIEWNARIVVEVYTSLIDDIMEEEWVELLAENELEEALLDSKRLDMTPAMQKELYNREKKFFIGKIAESMWFDWLNSIIAETWMPRIVDALLVGEDLADEQLFSFDPIAIRSKKRKVTFNMR